jgi:hypothetical protein
MSTVEPFALLRSEALHDDGDPGRHGQTLLRSARPQVMKKIGCEPRNAAVGSLVQAIPSVLRRNSWLA